ncbi:MAG: DNA-binding MarR family transcriptional regulator [Paracoccaceae bacterium]|jgi:DNA-binding MarR family transcriptional regulator
MDTNAPPCDDAPLAPGFHESYALYLMARASSMASAEFHAALAARSVPGPHWRVCAVLASGRTTVTRLAVATLFKQPTLTKILGRMEAEGLVTRTRDPFDGRAVQVALAPKGRALAADLIPVARAHEAAAFAALTNKETALLRRALRRFIESKELPAG